MPTPPIQAATAPDHSNDYVTMVGDGDSILGTRQRLWRSGTGADVQVTGSVKLGVSVTVSGGASGESYLLDLAAAPGQTLVPGAYVDAQRTSSRSAGHPGIDLSGEGRGCNQTTGRFTVLDAPADLSRLWLVFEQHCEGGEGSTFGEVRIGEPADSPDLMVAAHRIAWPAEYLGRDAPTVAVNVFATGDDEVSVGDAAVTDGDADFSVAGSTCAAVLQPGDSCAVYVGFRPAAAGHRTGVLTIGAHVVQLAGDTVPGRSSWKMQSEPDGPFVGGPWDLEPATTVFSASGDAHHVSLRAQSRSSAPEWDADFQAGPGQVLLPGTTVTPVSHYDRTDSNAASMRVEGARTCTTVTGSFTIQEATYQEGALRSLLVSFEEYCDAASAALTGTIAWRASVEDHTAPAGATDLQTLPDHAGAALSWTNPADGDWAESVVRRSTGDVAPTGITSGVGVYHGRHTAAVATGLASGSDATFAVFPVDSAGNVGPAATATVRGSRAGITGPSTLVAGRSASLTGLLTDSHSGAGLGGETVELESRRGTGDWFAAGTTTTDEFGRYVLSASPTASTSYRASFAAADDHLGVTSRVLPVAVSPRVSLVSDRLSGSRHASFALASTVFPSLPGRDVLLQRHLANGWHDVRSKPLSLHSSATFHVQPDRRGTYTYRVRRPADAGHTAGFSRPVTLHVR